VDSLELLVSDASEARERLRRWFAAQINDAYPLPYGDDAGAELTEDVNAALDELTRVESENRELAGALREVLSPGTSYEKWHRRAAAVDLLARWDAGQQAGFDCPRCGTRHYVGHCPNPDPDALSLHAMAGQQAVETDTETGTDATLLHLGVCLRCGQEWPLGLNEAIVFHKPCQPVAEPSGGEG